MRVEFLCDRCGNRIRGNIDQTGKTFGFCFVDSGEFAKFGLPGEVRVCDYCLHQDPVYQAEYGIGGDSPLIGR